MQTGYELLLPTGLLDYFEVVGVEEADDTIILHLDEKVLSTSENRDNKYLSKGFYPSTDINDFPIRDKRLLLRLRRRRWQDKTTGLPFVRDLSLVASGTHLTHDFAAFLKALY